MRFNPALALVGCMLALGSSAKIYAEESFLQLSIAPSIQLVDSSDDVSGLRLGLVSHNRNVTGLDIGLIPLTESAFTGVGLGIANMAFADVNGLQLGLFNYGNYVTGAQLGWYNGAKTLRGVQIGALNYSTRNSFLQIGMMNLAENTTGWQVGIFNVNLSAEASLPFMVFVNGAF